MVPTPSWGGGGGVGLFIWIVPGSSEYVAVTVTDQTPPYRGCFSVFSALFFHFYLIILKINEFFGCDGNIVDLLVTVLPPTEHPGSTRCHVVIPMALGSQGETADR